MDTEPAQRPNSNQSLNQIARRRAPWILICLVLVAAAAFGYSKQKTKQYTATASVSFSNNSLSLQIAGLSPGSSGNQLVEQGSDRELVSTGDMAVATAHLLGRGLTVEEVLSDVSVASQGESGAVNVSATSTSPQLAAAIANTYSNQFVIEQHRKNSQFFKSALALVKRQLATLPPAARFGSDGLDLEDRAHTLALLAELGYNDAQVAQEALVPSSPSSPKVLRDTLLGAFLGLLLGVAAAFVLERFDLRIRDMGDLEVIYGLPVVGVVPKSAALGKPGVPLPLAEAESFSLLRAHLRFFNIDRDLRTVVIASATVGDGKTTIACHLAQAEARAGSRVLLLEADLRQPRLAQQLGIQTGPGLTGVLIGAVPLDEAIQSVTVAAVPGDPTTGHTLDVLLAGAMLPPNPGELIESRAMSVVLDRAKSTYDLVVIDTPPLTAVSDAFPLLARVDGVVVVSRLEHSKRDSAEELHHVLASSGAPLLGIIVNGSKGGAPSPYPAGGTPSSPVSASSGGNVLSSGEFIPTSKP